MLPKVAKGKRPLAERRREKERGRKGKSIQLFSRAKKVAGNKMDCGEGEGENKTEREV